MKRSDTQNDSLDDNLIVLPNKEAEITAWVDEYLEECAGGLAGFSTERWDQDMEEYRNFILFHLLSYVSEYLYDLETGEILELQNPEEFEDEFDSPPLSEYKKIDDPLISAAITRLLAHDAPISEEYHKKDEMDALARSAAELRELAENVEALIKNNPYTPTYSSVEGGATFYEIGRRLFCKEANGEIFESFRLGERKLVGDSETMALLLKLFIYDESLGDVDPMLWLEAELEEADDKKRFMIGAADVEGVDVELYIVFKTKYGYSPENGSLYNFGAIYDYEDAVLCDDARVLECVKLQREHDQDLYADWMKKIEELADGDQCLELVLREHYNEFSYIGDPHLIAGIPFYMVGENASHQIYLGTKGGKLYRYASGEDFCDCSYCSSKSGKAKSIKYREYANPDSPHGIEDNISEVKRGDSVYIACGTFLTNNGPVHELREGVERPERFSVDDVRAGVLGALSKNTDDVDD